MSEQLPQSSPLPCNCRFEVNEWKVKYSKLEEKRNALRQAVKLLEQQIDKVQSQNLETKKAYEQERARVDKEGKERELTLRASLEKEISSLKSEILSLQRGVSSGSNNGNEKVRALEAKLAAGEKEISRLKELFQKEKTRADSEKKNAESEKRRANEAWKTVASEKCKADEARKTLEQKNEDQKRLLEALTKETDELRNKLGLETSKFVESNKKLEYERLRLIKERQRADMEKARAEKQRKLVEANSKKLMEEKSRADNLFKQVEENGLMIAKLKKELSDLSTKTNGRPAADVNKVLGSDMTKNENRHCLEIPNTEASNLMQRRRTVRATGQQLEAEKQKLLNETKQRDSEMGKADKEKSRVKKYRKRALEEKSRADQLSEQLNIERQRNQEFQQHLGQSSRNHVKDPTTHSCAATDTVHESTKMKLLKKELKLQKMKAKHAKEVAELERFQHSIVVQEVKRMKLDFGRISHRLDMLDSFFISRCRDIYEPKKNGNTEMQSWREKFCGLQSFSDELVKPYTASVEDPTYRTSSLDFISGTGSQLEYPPGGSPRKKLNHSGINSALASFSDRGLVGSQDKGDITVTTPARPLQDHLNQLTNVSDPLRGIERTTSNENVAVVAENNVGCPLAIDGNGVNKHGQKRKRLTDAVEFVDNVCLKSSKSHLKVEETLTTLHDRGYLANNDAQVQKRLQEKTNTPEEKLDAEAKSKNSKIEAPLVACGQKMGEDWQGPFLNDMFGSPEAVDADYMKLLELDNPADELLFQLAIRKPLSPTLPEINMEKIKAAYFAKEGGTCKGPHCWVENLSPSVELEVSNMEVESSKLSSIFPENERGEFRNQQEYPHGIFPGYFVGTSDTIDLESISRILSAIKSCMGRCGRISNSGWSLKNILVELNMEEKLPAKDKACAFFSMLLLQLSAIRTFGLSLNRDSIRCISSFSEHIHNVLSDGESRTLLAQLNCMDEFLSLTEDFLVEGKLILCSEMSSEDPTNCDRKISLVLDGAHVLISSEAAPAHLLVAGSVVLSAMCAATDQIGHICEASHRIFSVHRNSASSPVLTILHVFAHICGDKYFTWRGYNLLMTILKSLVSFLEGKSSSACILSHELITAEFSECPKCPFSDQAVPLDDVMSLLLEEPQRFGGVIGQEDDESLHGGQHGSSCLKSSAVTADARFHHPLGDNMYSDLIPMVELIAVNLGWEWTKTKILPQLLKILESCVQERSAAAIIILIGQLGRLGVDSSGCNDTSVENLRCHLYSFLCQVQSLKSGFPIHCAIVMALLPLLPLDFEKILENSTTLSETTSISVPAQAIGKWFSCLSKEEQASMYTLLRPTTVNRS